jgi:hypothetical protein
MRTEFEILTDINRLYMDLSPENISWDGMRSPKQVREAAREIHQQLKKLFKELGREVDDYEVMQELRALRGRRSAKQTMRRSASEVIRNLEQRIARLERQAGPRERRQKKANNIAATIIRQLGGGGKLQMMIGLKQLINEPNGVTLVFPLPKHRGAVNRVRITLNGKDLYDMEFIRTRGRSQKIVKEFNDVYAEDIKDRFEEGTGLYIRF